MLLASLQLSIAISMVAKFAALAREQRAEQSELTPKERRKTLRALERAWSSTKGDLEIMVRTYDRTITGTVTAVDIPNHTITVCTAKQNAKKTAKASDFKMIDMESVEELNFG